MHFHRLNPDKGYTNEIKRIHVKELELLTYLSKCNLSIGRPVKY